MFYDFHPADADAERAPLFVFFNGGPGSATSNGLLAWGTGPFTLVEGGGEHPLPNPASWTRFGNVLYIDQRMLGFGYGIAPPAGVPRCPAFNELDDAVDYARVLLDVLRSHPALHDSPIVLVGESYGGQRATILLSLFLRGRSTLGAPPVDLRDAILAEIDPRRFTAQILIQPGAYLGPAQQTAENAIRDADPRVAFPPSGGGDLYNIARPPHWSDRVFDEGTRVLADPVGARDLLGVDPRSIPGLAPGARRSAFRFVGIEETGAPDAADGALNAAYARFLGPLAPGDRYYVGLLPYGADPTCPVGVPPGSPDDFLANTARVRTFITNALLDAAVLSRAIPAALAATGLARDVVLDEEPGSAEPRPGRIRFTLQASRRVAIRFPTYAESGHSVTVTEATHLASDVAAWLAEDR
jgi:hypothetical protein